MDRVGDRFQLEYIKRCLMKPSYTIERVSGCMAKNVKVELPRIQQENVHTINFEDVFHQEEPHLMDGTVTDSFIENEEIENLSLSRMCFKNTRLLQSTFEKIDMVDVHVENCDLSNTSFMGGSLHRVTFKNCKLLGSDFTKAYLKNVSFENCILNLSSFIEPKLSQVVFDHSSLQSANFYECRLHMVAFRQCELNDIDLTQTSLDGVDISTCSFEQINLDTAENLKGCTVSPEQAIVFATMLGLKIRD